MDALEVWIHGAQVGLLERFPDENYRFSFNTIWLEDPRRPLLGQIFEDRRPYPMETSGLPCWFSHLLPQPDGPLHKLLQREARDRSFVDEDGDPTDFHLLAMVGEDLPGATVLLSGERATPLRRGQTAQAPPKHVSDGLYPSLAGNQLKLTVVESDRDFTVPVSGRTGRWIAKFANPNYPDLPRWEQATTMWAREAGLQTPETRLARVEDLRGLPEGYPTQGAVFVTRRFDRTDLGRVSMEDFAQILDRPPPNGFFRGSVEEIAAVVAALCPGDLPEMILRVVFCALSREQDGHLKNWSVLYPDRRNASLSPAYDLVSGVAYTGNPHKGEMVLPIGGSRRFEDLRESSFEAIARLTGRDGAELGRMARDASERIRAAWTRIASDLPLVDAERVRLSRHLDSVPLGTASLR